MSNVYSYISDYLNTGGESGILIRDADWGTTSLGPHAQWPQSLLTTLSILSHSSIPMFLLWGPEYILFYNDAYIPSLNQHIRHPAAMGKKGEEVWNENWFFIKQHIDMVKQGSNALFYQPEIVHLYHNGAVEKITRAYHLNPVKSQKGEIEGILVICNDAQPITGDEHLQNKKRVEILNKEISHVFNTINQGFFSRDTIAQRYLSLTAGCPKIYGYTITEFFNNPMLWAEVIHPDDKERVFEDDKLHKEGRTTHTEYRIFHKDKSVRWIEIKIVPTLIDGILTRVDGIVSDITERKNAELEIITQKELADSIINSLPGVFYLFDKQGRLLKWNKNFEDVTGYSHDEIIEMRPLDFFDEEEKELMSQKIRDVFNNDVGDVQACFLTKDKKKIPYYFNGNTAIYQDKLCIIGMAFDITERLKTEEALQKHEKMLEGILNSIPQAIFWKNTHGVYIGCNKVFAHNAGYEDTSSIIGKTDADLPWEPTETYKYMADDQEVMVANILKIGIIETQKQANGKSVWLETTKIPLTYSNGKVYGILGISEDITERKRAEEEREQMTASLIERNINLKQFSYIVSHNLRSPINRILGLASLFKPDRGQPEPNQRLIKYIVTEATNLDNVVKDLTTIVSYQDLGNEVKEEIIFEDELKLIKHNLESEIIAAKAQITSNFYNPDKMQSVRGYFHSILYNLLSNAVKYRHPDRHLKIHLQTHQDEKFIYFAVADNGLGIDLERHKDAMFALYSRFHKGIIPGKGIGLNLVKTQVETLGGKVTVKSQPGEGTTFTVSFLKV